MRCIYFTIALILSGLFVPRIVAAPIVVTRVVDTGTAIPAGSGKFNSFGPLGSLALAPAVSGRNVVFIGSGAGAQEGVYLSNGGVLTRVADRTTIVPGFTARFDHFISVAIDGSNVAFNGSGDSPFVVGIYKNVGGGGGGGAGLAPVSATTTGGFSSPEMVGSAAYVFFDGAGFGNEAIVTDAGGTLHTLVTDGIATPGGTGTLESINSNVAAGPGAVAFFGSSGVQRGIYLNRDGQNVKIADRNTAVPGGAGTFLGFSNVNLGFDGVNVAFAADDANGVAGLYRTRGADIATVATANTILPGYGKAGFSDRDSIVMSFDTDRIAFSNGTAIFAEVDGAIQKVIGVGDLFLGKTVRGVTFGTNGLSGDTLAFGAQFSDGTSGIFLATVPLPAGLPAGAAVGLGVVLWGRLRSSARIRESDGAITKDPHLCPLPHAGRL